jgi:hypothetical protein
MTVGEPGGTARGRGFTCCADVALRSCCNHDTALTVGELRARWAELDDRSPVLVAHNGSQADWAQHADVILAESGLVVARLLAPFAKQGQPAPGTVWVAVNASKPGRESARARPQPGVPAPPP